VAVAALVLGIFGIILSWFPSSVLGIPLAIVGLILGILARKNAQETQQPTGMATAGLAVSIIGLILGILFAVACFACVQAGKRMEQRMATDPQFRQQLEERQRQNKEFDDAMRKALEESKKPQAPAQQPEAPPTKK